MGSGICVGGGAFGRISGLLILFGGGLGRLRTEVPLTPGGAVVTGLSDPAKTFAAATLTLAAVGVGAGEGGRFGVEAQLSLVAGWLMADLVKREVVPDSLCSQSCTTVSIQV
jgi:hypothetical protein